MSYSTLAEEKRDDAIKAIETAIDKLSGIVIDKYYADDFNDSYKLSLRTALFDLIKIRDDLK